MESSKLLDVCKKNICCARKLITTDLAQRFSLDDLLSVIGSHELFVDSILNNPGILESLTLDQKRCIAYESCGAPIVLNNIEEFSLQNILAFGKNHLKVAKLLLSILEQYRLRITAEHAEISEINENLFLSEKVSESAIQAVCHDINNLSYEVKIKKIIEHVTFLGCAHLEIAQMILKSPWHISHITREQLLSLMVAHEEIALEVVCNNKILYEKLDIFEFTKMYLSIARWCWGQPSVRQLLFFNSGKLLDIGIAHAEIAHKILDNPDLYRRLNRDQLWLLSTHHTKHPRFEKICIEMLPKWLAAIHEEHLKRIVSDQPRILKKIMNEQNLLRLLNADNLTLLGIHDLTMAKKIINTPELLNKIDDEKISKLGIKWEEIANEIIEKPELLERLVLPDSKTEFSKYEDDEEQHYIVSYLVDMVAQHEKLARKFLSTPQYLNLLNGEHDLYHIAVKQETMATIILLDPNLTEKVDMVALGYRHAKTALLILSDSKLLARMTDVEDLHCYAVNEQEVREKILSSQELLKHFHDKYVEKRGMFDFLYKSSPSLRMIHLIQKNLKWFPASFHDSDKKTSMDRQKEVYEKIRALLLDKAPEVSESPMGIKRPRNEEAEPLDMPAPKRARLS